MAVFTASDLQAVRNFITGGGSGNATANYTKAQADAATQAIEDWFAANQVSLSNAINAATSPFTFSIAQKKLLVVGWLLTKFNRGGN